MKVIYQGISKEAQEKALAAHMATLDPPEKPAQEMFYHVDNRDGALLVKEKEKRTAKWMDERKAEKIKELEAADASMHLRKIVFKKGEVVDIPDDNDLVTSVVTIDGQRVKVRGKMFALVEQGSFKQAEEDKDAEALPTEAEVSAPRKPGRPKKSL